jgi:hypothetical protein
MLILEKLFKSQRTMKAVFGLDEAKFNALAERMDDEWFKHLESKPGRIRAPGGGQPSKIPTGAHKLAFILFYLKVYPTFDVMSVFSGINHADCCRWVHKLMPILEQLLGQKLCLPRRKISSVEEFRAAFPQTLEVIIDGMERPVRRAKKNDAAQALLGQKKEAHTQGDYHRGGKTPHRLPLAEQTGSQARQATG